MPRGQNMALVKQLAESAEAALTGMVIGQMLVPYMRDENVDAAWTIGRELWCMGADFSSFARVARALPKSIAPSYKFLILKQPTIAHPLQPSFGSCWFRSSLQLEVCLDALTHALDICTVHQQTFCRLGKYVWE